jgi:hypothetical protein
VRDIIYPIGGSHPPSSEEKCGICKRTLAPSKLMRCFRCKRLFCKSCATEDLVEGKYLVCLNCARKYVSPKGKFRGKYTPLTMYLSRKAKWTSWVKLHFSRIEGIIGKDLPESARQTSEWWKSTTSTQGKAWLNIGWNVEEVNLKEGIITFTRPEDATPTPEKQPKRKRTTIPISLPEYKPKKTKKPSLTRIAMAQARLQNISRKKSSIRKYRGKFKPKSAYEKRLWKTDEKP